MKKVLLYDTTLRDGTQCEGISLSLQDKLRIAQRLDQFGVHYIEGGWPGSNPKDLAFFKEIKKAGIRKARVAAFGSTRKAHMKVSEDPQIRALLEAETKTVTIFGKSWDFHVTEVFKTSLKEHLQMIYDSVHYLKSKKKEVIYDAEHFFDGFRANPEYALKTLQAAARAGADNLSLCETNGGRLPHEIRHAILRVKRSVKTPLGIHVHNDGELGVANSLQAVGEGVVLVQGTINGIGERCGNANLVSIIPNLQFKMNRKCLPPNKMKELTAVSHYVAEICNMPLMVNQPFTGRAAFAHKGGVHINAMMKNSKTYEHMDPRLIGNHRRFLVSELGGKTNIMLKAKELQLNLEKESAETRTILTEIQRLESEGYQFEAAEASFELLVHSLVGHEKKFFETKDVVVSSERIGQDNPLVEADVTVLVKGKEESRTASGNGPVDALYKALRDALVKFYPVLQKIRLTDYKVRVVNSEGGTGAKVRVFIEFQDEKRTWTTVGVNENVIEASWKALVEAIQYKLLKG